MRKFLIAVAALLATFAQALAQQQESSPEMQAMSAKIMNEVSAGLQCQVASIKLAKENETLKAQVKDLQEKANAQQHPEAGANHGSSGAQP